MRVCVVGAGYVGLVTAACLADRDHTVWCVDLDSSKTDAINDGEVPFHEHGLAEVLRRTVGRKLRATTDLATAVAASEITLICVGTPFANGAIDLGAIESATRAIGAALAGGTAYHTVVVRSTVVPGTTEDLVRRLLESTSGRRAGADFGLGMNPEFLTEGQALADFVSQDRIIVGAIDDRSREAIEGLYVGFEGVPRLRVNPRTAEMTKYASNALLATAISFSNELADLCTAVGGIDVVDVMRGVVRSRYLTAQEPHGAGWTAPLASFLEAGCGFGGSCLPKDIRALAAQGRQLGTPLRLLEAVEAVNRDRPTRLVDLVRRHFPALGGINVTVLGLAFKPGTDDTRETPARPIVDELLSAGARVTVYDPVAGSLATRLFGEGRVTVAVSLAEAVRAARAIVLVTRWPEFSALPGLVAELPDPPLVVDGRRVIDPAQVPRYEGIGLGVEA